MTTVTRAAVAAAAPRWVRDLLARGPGPATVLHSGADAVYLQVEDAVLAVVSRDAVLVPCALRTTLTSTAALTLDGRPPAPGTTVATTRTGFCFDGAEVVLARTTSHAVPPIDPTATPGMAARLAGALDLTVGAAREELPEAGLSALAAGDPGAVDALLGRGSGLTPLGDDVLCGWLAAVVAARQPGEEPVGQRALALAAERTTALSATLLRRAVHGEVIPPFAHLVRALAHRPDEVPPAVHELTRVGHTSGSGMALGLALALDHLGSRSTAHDTTHP